METSKNNQSLGFFQTFCFVISYIYNYVKCKYIGIIIFWEN